MQDRREARLTVGELRGDDIEVAEGRAFGWQLPPQEADIEADGRKRRLELVGHGAGQAAGVGDLAFGVRPALAVERLGEVGEDHGDDGGLAEQVEAVAEHAPPAGSGHLELGAGLAAPHARAGGQRLGDGAHGLVALGQLGAAAREHLCRRHAENVLGGPVVERHAAVAVHGDHARAHLLEDDVRQRHCQPPRRPTPAARRRRSVCAPKSSAGEPDAQREPGACRAGEAPLP